MKNQFIALAGLVFLASASVTNATGRMTCDSGDEAGWKSQVELEAAIMEDGWKVRKIKVDGGCYEVYGTNPDGKRVEAYFDPNTLEKLLVSQRGKILFRKE